MTNFKFNFPEIKETISPYQQARKCEEEWNEFLLETGLYSFSNEDEATFKNYNVDACIELLDTIHACESMLRNYPQWIVNGAFNEVVNKNKSRGYYSSKNDVKVSEK